MNLVDLKSSPIREEVSSRHRMNVREIVCQDGIEPHSWESERFPEVITTKPRVIHGRTITMEQCRLNYMYSLPEYKYRGDTIIDDFVVQTERQIHPYKIEEIIVKIDAMLDHVVLTATFWQPVREVMITSNDYSITVTHDISAEIVCPFCKTGFSKEFVERCPNCGGHIHGEHTELRSDGRSAGAYVE